MGDWRWCRGPGSFVSRWESVATGRIGTAVLTAVMTGGLLVALPASPAFALLADDAARPKERSAPVGKCGPAGAGCGAVGDSPMVAFRGVVARPGGCRRSASARVRANRPVGSLPIRWVGWSGGVASLGAAAAVADSGGGIGSACRSCCRHGRVLLRLSRADGATGPAGVSVDVDVSSFAGAFGGDWASRLKVVRLPGLCAHHAGGGRLFNWVPEPSSVMDSRLMRLSANVVVGPPGGVADDPRVARALAGEGAEAVGEPVFGIMALSASSDTGDFSQTPMSPSSSWQAGDSGGEFSWSYDLRVPPVPGGLEPDLSLGYSSGAVDGQTAGKNVQPSWVGEGWDFQPGYIERTYRACTDDVATGKEVLLYPGSGQRVLHWHVGVRGAAVVGG